jgi:hypothetical protein
VWTNVRAMAAMKPASPMRFMTNASVPALAGTFRS